MLQQSRLLPNHAKSVDRKLICVSSPRQDSHRLNKADPLLGHFIVTRGEDMWLKMVLNDGLLHADLHPGNILIRAPQVHLS